MNDDVPVALLKKHKNPAASATHDTYLQRIKNHEGHANVAGAIHRSLQQLKAVQDEVSPTRLPKDYFEVTPTTPWRSYGSKFEAGVDAHQLLYIHLESNFRGRPVMMVLANTSGITLAIPLPVDEKLHNWDCFAQNFPRIADILLDENVVRLTTSFELTKQFFRKPDPEGRFMMIDANVLGNIMRYEDYREVKKHPLYGERLACMCLVWSMFGEHHGPVHYADWEAAFGTTVPYPSHRKPDRILAWPRAHRQEAVTRAQAKYTKELAHAALSVGLHHFLWNAHHSELIQTETKFGKLHQDCLERGYPQPLRKGKSWIKICDERAMSFPDSRTGRPDPPTPTTSATESTDLRHRLSRPSQKIDEPYVPQPVVRDPFYDRDSDPEYEPTGYTPTSSTGPPSPEPSKRNAEPTKADPFPPSPPTGTKPKQRDTRPSTPPPTSSRAPPRRSPSPEPRRRPTSRRSSQGSPPRRDHDMRHEGPCGNRINRPKKGERLVDVLRPLHTRYALNVRQRINRNRADHRVEHPGEYIDGFLGGNTCGKCGEEPTHRHDGECTVAYYNKYGHLPRNCTVPCRYCDSVKHTTDACEYLHMRCVCCGFRGHMAFECKERSTEEWLLAYLECVHLGKLTRGNLDGPMRGRFGFGDTTGIPINDSTRSLISFRRNTLRHVRRKEAHENTSTRQPRDASVGWDVLHRQEQELERRLRDLDREKEAFYEEKERFNRERRSSFKRRSTRTKDTGTQTEDDDEFVVLHRCGSKDDDGEPCRSAHGKEADDEPVKQTGPAGEEPMSQEDVIEVETEYSI